MTKKEVAQIKEVIESLHNGIVHPDEMFPPTARQLIDWKARMDVLLWLLEATGHAECIDPSVIAFLDKAFEEEKE